jgi:hypothetical protein
MDYLPLIFILLSVITLLYIYELFFVNKHCSFENINNNNEKQKTKKTNNSKKKVENFVNDNKNNNTYNSLEELESIVKNLN